MSSHHLSVRTAMELLLVFDMDLPRGTLQPHGVEYAGSRRRNFQDVRSLVSPTRSEYIIVQDRNSRRYVSGVPGTESIRRSISIRADAKRPPELWLIWIVASSGQ